MSDNLHTLAHAQFGRWACTNQNVYIYNWSRCWYQLGGYVHTSAPAPIGSRRAAHLSAHAKFVNCDHVKQIEEQSLRERLGQCSFGISRPLKKTSWQHVQGGVEDLWSGRDQLGPWSDSSCGRTMWVPRTRVVQCRMILKIVDA